MSASKALVACALIAFVAYLIDRHGLSVGWGLFALLVLLGDL